MSDKDVGQNDTAGYYFSQPYPPKAATPDRAAADREAFEAYYGQRHSRGVPLHRADCREAYIAGAEHGRAEAEHVEAILQQEHDKWHMAALTASKDLATARADMRGWEGKARTAAGELSQAQRERDEAHADLARVEGERDAAVKQRKAAEQQLEVLHRMCDEWEDGRRTRSDRPIPTLNSPPRPDEAEALRMRVVEATMASWRDYRTRHDRDECPEGLSRAVWDACAALDRASPPAPSPVEAAAGRLRIAAEWQRAALAGAECSVNVRDLYAVLDALGAKGAG